MHSIIIFAASYLIAVPILVGAYFVFQAIMKGEYRLIIFSLVLAVFVVVLAKLGTNIIHDPRPFIRDGVTPLIHSATDNGFPSDHTLLASALALIAWRINQRLGIALGIVAVLIGWGRVAAGVHHVQDVIGAMVIVGLSYGLSELALRIYRRGAVKAPAN